MTPQTFEQRLRRLEKKLCCLSNIDTSEVYAVLRNGNEFIDEASINDVTFTSVILSGYSGATPFGGASYYVTLPYTGSLTINFTNVSTPTDVDLVVWWYSDLGTGSESFVINSGSTEVTLSSVEFSKFIFITLQGINN